MRRVAEYNETIAEMNLFDSLTNMLKIVEDSIKGLLHFLNALSNESPQKLYSLHQQVRSLKEKADHMKLLLVEYTVRLSIPAETKDLYTTIAIGLSRLTQLMDGSAYRLYMAIANNHSIDADLQQELVKFSEGLAAEFNSLAASLNGLRSDPRKTLRDVDKVFKYEDALDDVYRAIELKIYRRLQGNVPALMLLKESLDFMENAADVVKELGETLLYIALQRAVIV